MILYVVIAALAAIVGVVCFVQWACTQSVLAAAAAERLQRPGWVYFLAPAVDDPERPGLIKIGMTHRDPVTQRLPEIETMSPEPLEVIYVIPSEAPGLLELAIHNELKFARHHGEWFDRDATLMYLDHLKGAE